MGEEGLCGHWEGEPPLPGEHWAVMKEAHRHIAVWSFQDDAPACSHSSCPGLAEKMPRASGPAPMSVTLQGLEALERDAGGSRHELQEPGPSLFIEGLHRLPEPPDDVAVGCAVLQPGVGLPVVQIYLIQAAYDQLRRVQSQLLLRHENQGHNMPPRAAAHERG